MPKAQRTPKKKVHEFAQIKSKRPLAEARRRRERQGRRRKISTTNRTEPVVRFLFLYLRKTR